jgi:hypothetical protein
VGGSLLICVLLGTVLGRVEVLALVLGVV